MVELCPRRRLMSISEQRSKSPKPVRARGRSVTDDHLPLAQSLTIICVTLVASRRRGCLDKTIQLALENALLTATNVAKKVKS
jgi:hypothetical protein